MNRDTIGMVDLFAGIGGFHRAFAPWAECRFASEYDRFAATSYQANYGLTPAGDITTLDATDLPTHDLLCAGFPCQPFSIAGVSKKQSLGRAHGFLDQTQGTLFFDIARILAHHQPRAILLENVKNLYRHDKGRTFALISATLESLGYHLQSRILDAAAYLPQHRERLFIVGFLDPRHAAAFRWPEPPPLSERPTLASLLEPQSSLDPRYTLSDHLWEYLQGYAAKHRAAGNGFGYGLIEHSALTRAETTTRTLSARYHKDGSEILIGQRRSPRNRNGNPRRLTPREAARLMGYPDSQQIVVSDTQAYRQFGNSVVLPVVESIASELIAALQPERFFLAS